MNQDIGKKVIDSNGLVWTCNQQGMWKSPATLIMIATKYNLDRLFGPLQDEGTE
jgi:hypothetical protein